MPGQSHRRRAIAARPHPVSPPDALREPVGPAAGLRVRSRIGRPVGTILAALALALALGPVPLAQEHGTIRLRPASSGESREPSERDPLSVVGGPRRGFDYDVFGARLESLWFQRRALVAEGRDRDAAEQGRQIRAFCSEEGVGRVEALASALLVEAERFERQGDYERALDALELAAAFDADRPQTHWARASVLWESGRDRVGAATSAVAALGSAIDRSFRDLTVVQPLPLFGLVAFALTFALFAVAMAVRHQRELRHEIEEWLQHAVHGRVARAGGLAVLFLPVILWVGASWLLAYWIVVTFRYMHRAERWVGIGLLGGLALLGPAYRSAAALYAATSDPVVRTTLAAADGSYAPDRIVKLRGLVDAHPDEPVYRFLIAGLYKNGRYFEEAFAEYKSALLLDPRLVPAHINIGNIFYTTGQYAEAIANYRRALEIDPAALLALFNLHLAQSEAFRFHEAEESLARARSIDPGELARLFSSGRQGDSDRATVVDARIETSSLWRAAVDGGPGSADEASPDEATVRPLAAFSHRTSLGAIVVILACLAALASTAGHAPARRCARCGRPFCSACRSGRDHPEACSQCVHVLVHRDGLAPEARSVKLFEMERFAVRDRWIRRGASWLLPGAGQLLGGRPTRGVLLAVLWFGACIAFRPALVGPLERTLRFDSGVEWIVPHAVPLPFSIDVLSVAALIVLVATWLAANIGRVRAREA